MSETLTTREAELAALIAEQEADALYGDQINYSRERSLDAPLGHDADAGTLAEVIGDDDDALADLLGDNETWIALVSQKRATDEDVTFWRYLRQRQGWTYKKIAAHVGVDVRTVRNRLRAQRAKPSRLAPKLHAAKAVYETGARLLDVAAELYVEAGYASPESCYQALRKLFLARGVAIRPQSWKHGARSRTADRGTYIAYCKEMNQRAKERRRARLMKCDATTREGRPCSRWATQNTTVCNVHGGRTGGPQWWLPERIIVALNAWRDEHGSYPCPRDWRRSTLEHPTFNTVYNRMGSWPAALEAAALADVQDVAA